MGPWDNVEAQRVIVGLLRKPHPHMKARMPGPGARSITGGRKAERRRDWEAAQTEECGCPVDSFLHSFPSISIVWCLLSPHSVPGTVPSAGSPTEQDTGVGEVKGWCPSDEKEAKEVSPPGWVGLGARILWLKVKNLLDLCHCFSL